MSDNKYDYNFILDDAAVEKHNTSHSMILHQIQKNTHVLECGPGGGLMTRYMKEHLDCHVTVLELDPACYEKAMEYAESGLCVNLEEDEWLSSLQEESFDYIIYADVLEHLHNPTAVLKKMQRFLKPDGHVLLSVPNVANGDIVMNLMQDQFNYTPLGLLDDTHVHLFARDSLQKMIRDAGYYLEYETCITKPLFSTEQAQFLKEEDRTELKKSLSSHPNRYVYQYVCRLSREEVQTYSDVDLLNRSMAEDPAPAVVAPASFKATCFINTGAGYRADEALVQYYGDPNRIDLKYELPSGARSVRFDPLEGSFCMLKNLEVFSNLGFLPYRNVNGENIDDLELFATSDPQLEVVFSLPVRWIHVKADLMVFTDPMSFYLVSASIRSKKLCEQKETEKDELKAALHDSEEGLAQSKNEAQTLNRALEISRAAQESLEENILNLKEEISSLSHTLSDKETELENVSLRLQKARNKTVQLSKELKTTKKRYTKLSTQRTKYKREAAKWQASYNSIANSASWKLTKPVRKVLDALKRTRTLFSPKKTDNRQPKNLSAAEKRRIAQREYKFPKAVKISILVPIYNAPAANLNKMIHSVLNQTYQNWELCLVDGSDDGNQKVEQLCQKLMQQDSRIRYRRLEKNLGITGNLNVCLEMATGEYIGLCDQEDALHPSALYEVMHAICDKGADFIYSDENTFRKEAKDAFLPYYKPDFSPDTLRGYNYIGHLIVFSRSLLDNAGGFIPEHEGLHHYDLILRLTEKTAAIVHIPKILYFNRFHEGKDPSFIQSEHEAGRHALEAHLQRTGLNGEVLDTAKPDMFRIRYAIAETPLVSILIPNYEHLQDLKNCLESIFEKTTYPNYEIVIVENNSESPDLFEYYTDIQRDRGNVKVVFWESDFNFSAICNFGAEYCRGEYLLLLNNDIEVITPDWIQEMLMFAQRPDVGAVGAMLYYPDNTVQHAGVGIGIHGVADHLHRFANRGADGYMGRLIYAQNLSAVTAACMLLRRNVWDKLNGLDESFNVAFNDVDFCLRVRQADFLIIWTPFAELYHFESKSRGYENTPEKQQRFQLEKKHFQENWKDLLLSGDPYLNPHFDWNKTDFSLKKSKAQIDKDNRARAEAQKRNVELIQQSQYFDEKWYFDNNVDFHGKNVDLAKHYLLYGGFELRDPSEAFCSEEYISLNEDVKKARVNPLLHYELFGKWENRHIYGFEDKEPVFPENAIETEREYSSAPVVHKRVAIVSCFFSDGVISETLLYLLRGLREVVDQIMIVGDCPVIPEELDKLDGLVVYARFGRHEQYDFGSYKRGLEYARNHGYLEEGIADELVFINDSCYGPVYPFSETFDPMTKKSVDFWGYVILKSAYKNHISTYFLVFKRNIIEAGWLDEFLERVHGHYDRGRVIASLETELTVFLQDHGMHYEAIANTSDISFFNHPVTLLKKYRVPLVKKKAFTRRGLENQEEAIEIIRENSPELASLIDYKPFVPMEHHFPTAEEHLSSCKEICSKIAEKAKNGEPIKAVFLVFNATFFPSKPLFHAMLRDDLFDPYVAVIPDRRWGKDNQIPGMDTCEAALLNEGLPKDRIIRAECDELDRWSDVCADMDIVCYNSPYNLSSYRYHPRYAMGRAFLPIMVNYGFYRSKYDNWIVSLPNYTYLWKAFFECEDSLRQYQENSPIGGANADVVGYIKMDPLSKVSAEKHERKRVLVALHHSVEGGINQELELGNMVRYSDYFLNLPDRYPEIDFVYRPHPHLFQILILRKLWSEEEVDNYISTLKSKENVIWSNGQDYFIEFAESDGCIQDCGSFLVEYLYTGKPCCFMLKDPSDIEEKFAPLGQKCLEQCYLSYDTDAIDSFIEKVIIQERDEKAETRQVLAKEVMVNYPHAADAALESIKRGIFDVKQESEQKTE